MYLSTRPHKLVSFDMLSCINKGCMYVCMYVSLKISARSYGGITEIQTFTASSLQSWQDVDNLAAILPSFEKPKNIMARSR